jgi:hypothetical protein
MIGVEQVGQSLTGERMSPPPAILDANGDFVIRGVFPGRYRLALAGGAPAGYAIESAIFGGRDAMDQPLVLGSDDRVAGGVVTLSNRTTEVSGTVQDSGSRPASGVTLVVFSAGRTVLATRVAQNPGYAAVHRRPIYLQEPAAW